MKTVPGSKGFRPPALYLSSHRRLKSLHLHGVLDTGNAAMDVPCLASLTELTKLEIVAYGTAEDMAAFHLRGGMQPLAAHAVLFGSFRMDPEHTHAIHLCHCWRAAGHRHA